jgi:hypothetical protein
MALGVRAGGRWMADATVRCGGGLGAPPPPAERDYPLPKGSNNTRTTANASASALRQSGSQVDGLTGVYYFVYARKRDPRAKDKLGLSPYAVEPPCC